MKLDFQKIKHWLCADFINLTKLTRHERLSLLYLFQTIFFMYWGFQSCVFTYGDYYWDGGSALVTFIIRIISEKQRLLDRKFLISFFRDEVQYFLSGSIPVSFYSDNSYIFKEIGLIFLNRFDGPFVNVVKKTDTDVFGLLSLVLEYFPYKQALLFVSDGYYFYYGYTYGIFRNIGQLIVRADYMFPRIFRKLNRAGVSGY